MRNLILAGALGLALAACTSGARVDSTSTDGVTLLYPEGDRAEAERLAIAECQKYNKRARVRSVSDRSSEKFAIYDCIT